MRNVYKFRGRTDKGEVVSGTLHCTRHGVYIVSGTRRVKVNPLNVRPIKRSDQSGQS